MTTFIEKIVLPLAVRLPDYERESKALTLLELSLHEFDGGIVATCQLCGAALGQV